MAFRPPVKIRRLRAQMELSNLTLKEVSDRSGVGYSNCSMILCGRLHDPEKLAKIVAVIKAGRGPKLQLR